MMHITVLDMVLMKKRVDDAYYSVGHGVDEEPGRWL